MKENSGSKNLPGGQKSRKVENKKGNIVLKLNVAEL